MNHRIGLIGLALVLSIVLPCLAADRGAATGNPMIHADGRYLADGNGQRIVLKGVNVEGWLQWSGPLWGCGFRSESTLRERLTQLVGADETAKFRAAIYDRFLTEADIARMAAAGFNVVRVMINHRLLDGDGDSSVSNEAGWAVVDRALDWCAKHGVYAVLDLHSAPGGQSRMFVVDPDPGALLWNAPPKRARTIALWRAIAQRYRDRAIVAGYDLLGEPQPPQGPQLVDLYRDIIAAIREVDTRHLIILEGSSAARDFSMFSGPLDANEAYSFHLYTWFGDDRRKWLERISAVAKRDNVPLWCGEWGENTYPMLKSTRAMFESADYAVYAGWCFWTWKRAPTAFPALLTITPSDKWKQVGAWINHPLVSPRPSAADALTAMNEFLAAVDSGALVEDQTVMDILTGK